jgi:hypothetical protein
MAATGLFTVKLAAGEIPPPGEGLWTVTEFTELPLSSTAGTVTFN